MYIFTYNGQEKHGTSNIQNKFYYITNNCSKSFKD